MVTKSEPLVEVVESLQDKDDSIDEYYDNLCDYLEENNPSLRAFIKDPNRRERLMSEAKELMNKYAGKTKPALYGIPIGVKDIFHVNGFTTRAGSAIPPELIQGPESAVVSDLKDKGALILGKTVTTEFAGAAPGLTRNPHDLSHTPGGSSSGSAAAVAAGMCPLALGTQTGGSVNRPAAYCGVVGFKPSFDRLSTHGIIPRAESLDQVGLFTQEVSGMELAASIVCDDWESIKSKNEPVIGIPRGPYLDKATKTGLDAFEDHLERLQRNGYEIKEVSAFGDFEKTDKRRRKLARGELAATHAEWYKQNKPFYRVPLAERIEEGYDVTMEELFDGKKVIEERKEHINELMDEHNIDIWVSPPAPGPAPNGLTSTGSSIMNRPWTDAGFPSITLPAGKVNGLPVGLQCVSRNGLDEKLLKWSEGISKAL